MATRIRNHIDEAPSASFRAVGYLFLWGLILAIGGGAAAFREIHPYTQLAGDRAFRYQRLVDGEIDKGFSNNSKRLALDVCQKARVSYFGRLQPSDQQLDVAKTCLVLADEIVEGSPANGFAWYVGALMSSALFDTDGMNARLEHSYRTAPNEQWLAELRVNLAEDNLIRLSPTIRALHDQDLGMLVLSERGISSIARRWISEPSFRDRILAIVDRLSEHDQERFVDVVRDIARSGQ